MAMNSKVMGWVKMSLIFLTGIGLCGCSTILPRTTAEIEQGYGYTPLDPLPVKVTNAIIDNITDSQVTLLALPDETMRLAVGQVSGSGNITYGPASAGYAGSNYVVVLDYIKYNTLSLPLYSFTPYNTTNTAYSTVSYYTNNDQPPDKIMPIYVGVGLRITANIKVNSGNISLGNLIAIGAAADAKNVTGTLVIQTMGISGPSISSAIPIPSDVNGTTIANALMAVGTIKSKFYDNDGSVNIRPQVLGEYNNLGINASVNDIISSLLQAPPILDTTQGASTLQQKTGKLDPTEGAATLQQKAVH
jgi:hypothetical protein